ncbi:MAG: YwaF family protein [Clostridia bacterium]|nr:YwaF family protein [Clostridia bacterium]
MRPTDTLLCTAVLLLLLAVASAVLNKKSEQTRRRALIIAGIATMAVFIIYKVVLFNDREFDRLTASMGGFNWWGELPLHLCNVNMILIPFAVHYDSRPLKSFCFFVGPLGAMMALLMPGLGFDGYPIWLPRMLCYYGIHFAILLEGLALATLRLYRPRLRDVPVTVVTLLAITLVAFGINLILRATGLYPKANYFFSVETEGNAILELFHRLIPVPFLYLLPGTVILVAYMAVVMAVVAGTERVIKRIRK